MDESIETDTPHLNEVADLRRRIAELEALVRKSEQTEEALRANEIRFRRFAEYSSEAILLLREGRFVDANERLLDLCGYSRAELQQMSLFDLVAPEWREALQAKTGSTGQESCEIVGMRKDGTLVPLELSARTEPRQGDDLRVVVVRDITEQKRAEEAARESEAKFSSVIRASPMGVHMYVLEPDGSLVFVGANPAADRMLGVDNRQFIGKTLEEAFPPMADSEVAQRYRLAAAEGQSWQTAQVDYVDEQIAGAYEVFAFQTSPNRMAAMFLDITDRLRAEEALRESEAKHRSLFESMSNGVVYRDAEGRIISANSAAEEILGRRIDEMRDCTATDQGWQTIHEDGSDFPGHEHPAMETLRSGENTHAIVGVFNRREGAYRWLDVHATPQFRPGEDRPYQVFTTLTDITQRKQAEEQRQDLEEQLRQAQKMEAIGRLAGGLAHDFNNLLTAIGGYSDLLGEALPPDHPGRPFVEEIIRAERRAAALTEQLLAFSRKQMIEPKVIDLNEIIVASHKMLASLIGEDIDLKFELVEQLGAVKADRNQIDQILINLAANARDAMPEGGMLVISTQNVELSQNFCQSHPEVSPGRHVLLHVSDTGSGMDEETRALAFEPFFTTKDPGQGTGLGLATVYGVARQNGGTATVYSARGAGTTVDIFLPRATDDIEREPERGEPADLSGSETILLVEDEDTVRDLTARMLQSRGYDILNSATVQDALRICREREGPIDLVLTDVIMPEMNGKELYQQLVALRANLKVLYISGYSADIIAQRGAIDATTNFLGKPYTAAELAKKVRQVLDQT